jgi:alanine dehydrogenase
MPSAVVRTSSHALNNALLPYILAIAGLGFDRAVASDTALARGVAGLSGRQPAAQAVGESGAATTPTEVQQKRSTP